MYLAVIIDLYSRRVVGWSIADHMRTELVLEALAAALGSRTPSEAGLLFHSDRGSQYASDAHQNALDDACIGCSMSRRANCWDNAVAESFFSTLKTELVHNIIFTTKSLLRVADHVRPKTGDVLVARSLGTLRELPDRARVGIAADRSVAYTQSKNRSM